MSLLRRINFGLETWFCIAILSAALVLSLGILAHAQNSTVGGEANITFPVAELGSCTSKENCKSFCDQPGNMQACIKFAQEHGLINGEEAARAQKFGQALALGGGPGSCKTPQECDSFCSNINNIEACVKFAEEHGAPAGQDQNVREGKKILSYLKSGGKMPGGCTSKDSCETYCSDFSHSQECFEFAQKAGLAEGGPEGEQMSPEQFQKLMQLTQSGQTPGGCKSKNECESYCKDQSHFEECITFSEKAGFINSEEASRARKTGGKGPGDCNSKESCEAFCNAPANRQACFSFAKEHGLISQEDLQRMQEGMVRMRQGLENAPTEVVACLKSTLGPNIIEDIQSGNLTPGPEIGDRMKDCFERFGKQMSPQANMGQMPQEMLDCVKSKLGGDFEKIESGQVQMTPEMGDAFRVCGQQMQLMGPGTQGGPGGPSGPGGQGMTGGPPPEAIQNFLRSAPQEVSTCLQSKLGSDFEGIRSGQIQPSSDVGEKMRECFESFRPQDEMQRMGPQGQNQMMGPQPMMPGPSGGGLPLQGQMPTNEIRGEFPGMQQGLPPSGAPPQGMEGQMPGQQFMQPGTLQPMTSPPLPPPGDATAPPPDAGGSTPPPSGESQPPSSRNASPSLMGLLLNVFAPLLGGR